MKLINMEWTQHALSLKDSKCKKTWNLQGAKGSGRRRFNAAEQMT